MPDLKLKRWLDETGRRQAWLAAQLGIERNTLHGYLTGRQPLPAKHRRAIIQLFEGMDVSLFEEEADDRTQ